MHKNEGCGSRGLNKLGSLEANVFSFTPRKKLCFGSKSCYLPSRKKKNVLNQAKNIVASLRQILFPTDLILGFGHARRKQRNSASLFDLLIGKLSWFEHGLTSKCFVQTSKSLFRRKWKKKIINYNWTISDTRQLPWQQQLLGFLIALFTCKETGSPCGLRCELYSY